MNRRSFLKAAALAPLGLAILPVTSGLPGLLTPAAAEEEIDDCCVPESKVIEEIVQLLDSWEQEHPGTEIRASLLKRLETKKTLSGEGMLPDTTLDGRGLSC